jgi:ATP-dependent DNA ligase
MKRLQRLSLWLKVKCLNGYEFLVVGWTDLDGRSGRVMLLAYVIRTRLDYVGRVGTGNDDAPSGILGAACNRWPQQKCHRAALSR